MSTLTKTDVASYLIAFEAKYGHEYRGTIDAIETIMTEADTLDVDTVIESMSIDEEESGLFTDDEPVSPAIVDATPGSPYSYAVKIDAELEKDLEEQWQAALANKRGAAVIMNDLFRVYGKETISQVWPKPGSYKKGHGPADKQVGDNEAYDREKTVVRKPNGETSEGERSFYAEFVALSVRGKDTVSKLEKTKEQNLPDKDEISELAALQLKLSNFKSAIVRAVELAQRLHFCNQHTRLAARIITETVNGKVVPKRSPKLIYAYSMDEASDFKVLSIGQFLGKKVWEGATFAEIIAKRVRDGDDTGPDQFEVLVDGKLPINRLDKVLSGLATLIDDIEQEGLLKNPKLYNAVLTHFNGAGTDPELLSLYKINQWTESLLSKPGLEQRLRNLLADGGKIAKAV